MNRKTSIIVSRKSDAQRIRKALRRRSFSSYVSSGRRGAREVYMLVPDTMFYERADNLLRSLYFGGDQ